MELNIKNNTKFLKSENYNYVFDLKNGNFARWGKKEEDDPLYSPFGPEILDCEITTRCDGIGPKDKKRWCSYCYKSNTKHGHNMDLETFKKIIEKINFAGALTQVAFGLGSSAEENPALWDMCDFLRENHIIPNGTVADINPETAQKIANHFGGVAVSYHEDWEVMLNTIDYLHQARQNPGATLQQINIHFCIYEENFEDAKKLFELIDSKKEKRLEGLNAVVLLSLKQQGRAKNNDKFHPLSIEKFTELSKYALDKKIGFGFDSCSANKFRTALKRLGRESEKIIQAIEPCESGLFSSYVNAFGNYYPCSFNEEEKYKYPLLDERSNFEVYWKGGCKCWRPLLLNNKRNCPTYRI